MLSGWAPLPSCFCLGYLAPCGGLRGTQPFSAQSEPSLLGTLSCIGDDRVWPATSGLSGCPAWHLGGVEGGRVSRLLAALVSH